MKFSPIYQQQVGLLMKVMPEVSKIKEFALHGVSCSREKLDTC